MNANGTFKKLYLVDKDYNSLILLFVYCTMIKKGGGVQLSHLFETTTVETTLFRVN